MAFRTKRRRKPRVVWLPTYGGLDPDGEGVSNHAGIRALLQVNTEQIQWDAFPLTFDYTFDATIEQNNEPLGFARGLKDIVNANEWRLRRIVGKCPIWVQGDETDDPAVQAALVQVGLGFIVCNTYDDGDPTTDFTEVNPLAQESMEDPWIWRRTWILNPYANGVLQLNPGVDFRGTWAFADIPGSNARYGSVADGPHIDQKTARRIHRNERLYCVFAARPILNTVSADFAAVQINMQLDYRLLGSLVTGSAGNRGNASR